MSQIGHIGAMDRNTAIKSIREHVNQIATHVTAIHPLAPGLSDPPTQAEMQPTYMPSTVCARS